MSIHNDLQNDILGGTASVIPVMDTDSRNIVRYLIRSKPAHEIMAGLESEDYTVDF